MASCPTTCRWCSSSRSPIPSAGVELLQRFRASLELIRLGLWRPTGLPHAGVLKAICGCLPGESPTTRVEVQAKYGDIQPVEFVGLDVGTTGNGIPAFAGMTSSGRPGIPVERGELR